MRTATIEAVLGPVADAIGEFLIANEEAELNDIPLGDLTPVAEGVAASVKALLDVAQSLIVNTADEELKLDMPLACKEVDDSVDQLKDSAAKLRDDPLNTLERKRMIEGATGLLNGTRHVLECFDDYEVRKILKACDSAKEQVIEMREINSLDGLVKTIQPACQSLIVLAQLTDKRVEELLDPWTKVAITQARDVIKGSSTLMVSSSKAFVTNADQPSRDSANESRRLCIERLLEAIEEVRRIVQIKQAPPEEKVNAVSALAKDRIQVREALMGIHHAVIARSPEALDASLKLFDPAKNNVLQNARQIAAGLHDQQKKQEILATVANIERLRKELEAAARYAIEHPDDPAAQQRLLDLMRETDAEFDKLDRLVNEALYQDINASMAMLGQSGNSESTLAKLIAAAHAGNVDSVNAYVGDLQKEAAALKKFSEQVIERSTDPEAARKVKAAQKVLDDLLPQVISAAKTVALNPNDPSAKEHLTAIVSEWETGVSKLRTAIDNAQSNEDIVSASAQAVKADLAKFQEACAKQDANLLKEASIGITQKMQVCSSAVAREVENTDDAEYKQKLELKAKEMQNVLPELQQKAKVAFSNPKDAAAQQALKDTSDKLVLKMNEIRDLIHEHHHPSDQEKWAEMERHIEEAKKREEEKKRQEEELRKKSEEERLAILKAEEEARKVREEEERKAAEEEQIFLREQERLRQEAVAMQKSNPIKAAALDLKHEANKWDSDGNSMIQMSQSLADTMALLSELANMNTPEAKKKLIEAARKIAADSKIIEKEAKKVAENCSDKRLKQDLNVVADRIGTIANQIKILSTVKAANPNDHDNDAMLITAATNLMSSVKSTIDASQAAQIRSFKTTATVVTAALKWKRKAGGAPSSEPKSLASIMTKAK